MAAGYVTTVDANFIAGLVIAMTAGFLIGYERGSRGEPAGVRTHTLVCIGAMLFSVVSQQVDPASPSRIAANVVVGMGFLGAGIIMHYNGAVHGLTSAASLWIIAAIGVAIGYGFYVVAIITILMAFLILKMPHIGEHRTRDDMVQNEHNPQGVSASAASTPPPASRKARRKTRR